MVRRIVNHYYQGKLLQSQKELEQAVCNLPSLADMKKSEKLNTPVSCKVYESLALWLKCKGASIYLRRLIEEAKIREEEQSHK